VRIIDSLVSYNDSLQVRDPSVITTIVFHCTELPTLPDARQVAEESALKETKGWGNCAHFYIDRDGQIYRYVEEERIAHHVAHHNTESIGIELVNSGRYPSWFSSKDQVPREPYTEAQICAVVELMGFLKTRFPNLSQIARHSDLDKRVVPAEDNPAVKIRRRIDPGPLFPWKQIQRHWEAITKDKQGVESPR
jgi:N-acetylmuramoyl-L-alanine amidase